MPPPTLASKRNQTPFSAARASSSSPLAATNSLLEVTKLLPARMDSLAQVKAGSTPPRASTTTDTSGSSRITEKSPVNRSP